MFGAGAAVWWLAHGCARVPDGQGVEEVVDSGEASSAARDEDGDAGYDAALAWVGDPMLIAVRVPSGFYRIASASGTGVDVYRKDYSGGQPDYVAVVDLGRATVRSFAGAISGSGPDHRVGRKTHGAWWTDAKAQETSGRTLRFLVNGTFFSTSESPTPIAFGLKVGGAILSTGYSKNREYPGLEKVLRIDVANRKTSIAGWSADRFAGAAPDMIGALDPAADKSRTRYLPRTFAGILDQDGNGIMDHLLLFGSAYARQADADSVLRAFGAEQVVMLDGGGGTFVRYRTGSSTSTVAVDTSRSAPHAIAVYSGR